MLRNKIHIALLDHHILIRKAIKTLIQERGNINVTIDTSDAKELFQHLSHESKTDVLLLDIFPHDTTVQDVLENIRKNYSHMRVIILTSVRDQQIILDLLDQGALAYIPKEADPSQLIEAIETVMQNRIYKNKILTEALYWKRYSLIRQPRSKNNDLTDTDRKVLSLLWQEKNTREIAEEVLLSMSTIEKIKQNLKEKLNVKTTIGLIKYAVENKIILVNQTVVS